MSASVLQNPQSLNLYAYVGNDSVNFVDPSGLFFKSLFKGIGKIFGFIAKAFKWIKIAVAIAVAVLSVASFGFGALWALKAYAWMIGYGIPGIFGVPSGLLTPGTVPGGASLVQNPVQAQAPDGYEFKNGVLIKTGGGGVINESISINHWPSILKRWERSADPFLKALADAHPIVGNISKTSINIQYEQSLKRERINAAEREYYGTCLPNAEAKLKERLISHFGPNFGFQDFAFRMFSGSWSGGVRGLLPGKGGGLVSLSGMVYVGMQDSYKVAQIADLYAIDKGRCYQNYLRALR